MCSSILLGREMYRIENYYVNSLEKIQILCFLLLVFVLYRGSFTDFSANTRQNIA